MQNATECLTHTWKTAPAVLQLCCIMQNPWMYENLVSAPVVATNEYQVGIKLALQQSHIPAVDVK